MNLNAVHRAVWPVLLNDAAMILLLFLAPTLAPNLAEPSGMTTLVVIGVYTAFLIGTFMVRKLQPTPPASGEWLGPTIRGILAGLFGLVLTLLLSWQLGFFESFPSAVPMVLGEGEAAAYFVFAPGAWLAVSMLYILFLAFPVNESVAPGESRYRLFALMGLVTAGLLLVSLAAQGQAIVPETNRLLWLLAGFVLLLALFAPPRLLYATRFTEMRSRDMVVMLVPLGVVCAAGAWLLTAA